MSSDIAALWKRNWEWHQKWYIDCHYVLNIIWLSRNDPAWFNFCVLRYPGVNIGNTFPEQLYRARYSHYYERLMQSFQKVRDMDKHQLTNRFYIGDGEMIPYTQSSRCYLNFLGEMESETYVTHSRKSAADLYYIGTFSGFGFRRKTFGSTTGWKRCSYGALFENTL